MKDSKLINILKCLTYEEIKSLEKFIESSYFLTGRDVSGLLKILKKHFPEFDSEEIERENVYKKLFPREEYNEAKLKNLTSGLTRLSEQFLIHNSLKSNEIESEKLLVEQYMMRNNEKLFSGAFKLLESKLHEKLFDSKNCFDKIADIEFLKEEFYLKNEKFNKSIPAKIRYTEHFIISFFIKYLRMCKDRIIIKDGYNMDFDSPVISAVIAGMDFGKILHMLEQNKHPLLWLIQIYYYAFKTVSNPEDKECYLKFREAFAKNINKFSDSEKYIIYNDFLFYCTKNYIPDHKQSFKNEYFEIYREMFHNNAYTLSEGEFLNIITYRNVMFIAIGLKEYKWLDNFIENYTDKLRPEYRQNMLNLARAYLSFEKRLFDDALKYINLVQYDLFIYKLDIRNLQLRVYYELNIIDQAFHMIDSYRHFLNYNSEFSKEYLLQYHNFINLYSKLIKARSTGNFSNIDSLISETSKTEILVYRTWLIEKGKELLKIKTV